MLLYDGNHPRTIPIHETSPPPELLAQADKALPQDCDYYVICGDDMILHQRYQLNRIS